MVTRRIICPGCGAPVEVGDRKKFCEYCGSSLIVDDGTEHVQINNAEDMGYQFEKGRQRARAEQQQENSQNEEHPLTHTEGQPKRKHTTLWVLGWVCCFPIPLTILIVRSKRIKDWLKVVLLVLLWGVILLSGGKSGLTDNQEKQSISELPTKTSNIEVTVEPDHNIETSVKSQETLQDMVIVDYGYSVVNGCLYVGFELNNPNNELYIEFPSVRITARDHAGALLGTGDMTLSEIYPNTTITYGTFAFEVDEMPTSVEIVPLKPNDYNIKSSTLVPEFVPLEVMECVERKGDIIGEVKNPNNYDLDMVAVTIILRDEDGGILYADTTYVDKVGAGTVVPFSEYLHYDGNYSSFTVTAMPW